MNELRESGTLAELLHRVARQQPEATAMIYDGRVTPGTTRSIGMRARSPTVCRVLVSAASTGSAILARIPTFIWN